MEIRSETGEIFNFLPLISNSITISLSYLLLSISAIMPSNTINIFRFFCGLYSPKYFYKYLPYHLSIQ